ncbi:MAG: metallophosphoesterase family protein [Acidobacteriota bacterium]|jgi:predicted phosphodiesterase
MRYGLISDIHANLPALEAVLAHIDEESRPDAVYHLGDLVGYAPWPNEVVELLQSHAIAGVAGNYDSTVAADYKHCGCRYEDEREAVLALRSYEWTREHCSEATKTYLGGLPFRIDLRPHGGHIDGSKLVLVHGTPSSNTVYWTQDRDDDFFLTMASRAGMRDGDVIAFGHTHVPWAHVIDDMAFINAGSVGRSKGGDWRACYAIIEVGGDSVEVDFIRVEYDIDAVAHAIRRSRLPDELAYYLRTGGRSLSPS